jgi:hypothetical protein
MLLALVLVVLPWPPITPYRPHYRRQVASAWSADLLTTVAQWYALRGIMNLDTPLVLPGTAELCEFVQVYTF